MRVAHPGPTPTSLVLRYVAAQLQYLCMKTTVEISETLLAEAKALAAREQTSLRVLIERGLRQVIRQRTQREDFELEDGSVPGNGLRSDLQDSGWPAIRRAIYETRGG